MSVKRAPAIADPISADIALCGGYHTQSAAKEQGYFTRETYSPERVSTLITSS